MEQLLERFSGLVLWILALLGAHVFRKRGTQDRQTAV
jgi:hypothetical protein